MSDAAPLKAPPSAQTVEGPTIESLQTDLKHVLDRETATQNRHDARVDELEKTIGSLRSLLNATRIERDDLRSFCKGMAVNINKMLKPAPG